MVWITFGAVVIAIFLIWNLFTRFGADRIETFNAKRRGSARIVGRAELVDGNRHALVALAVTSSMFFYENADMEGAIDLESVREIEYDTELSTGHAIESGKVLRLRCHSQTFEFVLRQDVVAAWASMLPARREAAPLNYESTMLNAQVVHPA